MLWDMISLIKTPSLLLAFILMLIFPLLFSIAFHELAHGWVAYKFGDITPKVTGRLTLNPFAHLHPVGTLCLFIFGLGWAKPVLINPDNIKSPTKEMLVALAGPLSNFLLATIFTGLISVFLNIYRVAPNHPGISFFDGVVTINIALAIFNLIPIPPLDGSRIISWLLPKKLKHIYARLEQYGIAIMMLLLFAVGFGPIFKISMICKYFLYVLLKVNG